LSKINQIEPDIPVVVRLSVIGRAHKKRSVAFSELNRINHDNNSLIPVIEAEV